MQVQRYQLRIINTETANGVVFYIISVLNTQNKMSWQFKERYKNMLNLHLVISEESKTVPEFPPKKYFGNMDPDFISTRKAALQNYFNTLLQHNNVEEIKSLKNFLTRGEQKQIRENTKSELTHSENEKIQKEFSSSKISQSQQSLPNQVPSKQLNKIPQSHYDKITAETNQKFIDLAYMISAPEDNDIKKKKFLYDQVKVEVKADNKKPQLNYNSDGVLINANLTFESQNEQFFKSLSKLQSEIDRILHI